MELVKRLECDCNPEKVYATPSTFRQHLASKRHSAWARQDEVLALRARLVRAESTIAQLKQRVEELQVLLREPRLRRVPVARKKAVAAAQGWRCKECNELLSAEYEVDHVLALCRGGSNEEGNLQALCPPCHKRKTAADRRH